MTMPWKGVPAWSVGAVLVAAAAYHALYATHGIAVHDEGVLLDGAARILAGDVFARDFHAPYGPGRYLSVAAWLEIFGASVLSFRWLAVAMQAAADALLFRLVGRIASPVAALCCAVMLAVGHGALHKSFVVLGSVLFLEALWHCCLRRDPRGALLGGFAVGGLFLFRYDAGVFAAVALAAAIAADEQGRSRRTLPRIAIAGLGAILPVAAMAMWLWWAGADPGLWWDRTLQRISLEGSLAASFPWPLTREGLAPPEQLALFVAIALFAFTEVTLLAGVLWRRYRGAPWPADGFRLGVALLGLLLLNQIRIFAMPNRLFEAGAPAYLALALLLAFQAGRAGAASRVVRADRAGWISSGALVVATLLLVGWVSSQPRSIYAGSHRARLPDGVLLDLPRAKVTVVPALAEWLGALDRSVQEAVAPGEPIATGPGCPLVAFLADRRLALPYADSSYYFRSERFQREAIEILERDRPPVMVACPGTGVGLHLGRDAPLLAAYFESHYTMWRRHGPFLVLHRSASPREGSRGSDGPTP